MWDDDIGSGASNQTSGGSTFQHATNGFFVGRGRGFNNSSFTPEVGQQTNGSAANDDDCGWDDNYGSSNQQSSYNNSSSYGNSYQNKGSNKCYKCDQEGHMSRDCPNSGSGGGGGDRNCFKCQQPGHMSRDCPNAGSGGGDRNCFKCQQPGHMSRDCPNSGSGGGDRNCFKCQQPGHMSRDCPNAGSGGGDRNCFKCQQPGHMSRDCPNAGSGGGDRACHKCNETGHFARECPNAGSGGGGGGNCYKCNEPGHISRDCPNEGSGGGGGDKTCRKCNETGHFAKDCPQSGGNKCFKCQEEGHMARDCTKEVLDEDGKPKPPPYLPPDISDNADDLFQGVPMGINFSKYANIHVDVGKDAPPPIPSFEASGLSGHLLQNVRNSKYTTPTPVQKYSIPIIMAKRDLMACAQTGSGKTAAFLLPIIHDLVTDSMLPNNADRDTQEPLALIVAPTRELIIQIGTEARKFAYDTVIKVDVLYGGTSMSYQFNKIKRGSHILAATPGRLLDFLEKGKVSFSSLRYLVLDEADRMLDMGFAPTIRKMVEHESMPQKGVRQTLMFSATFPEEIQRLAGDFLHNYLFLTVGMVGAANTDVEQTLYNVGQFDKKKKLLELLKVAGTDRTLVFVEQKRTADFIASTCSQNDLPTTSIHGDRLQREREEALRDFRVGRMPVLVATAVAARGLDIKDVRHVINYDLPQTIDEYVHRIGRTGRVGNLGRATSFYDSNVDQPLARSLKKILIDAQQEIPDWLSEEADNSSGAVYGGRGNFGGRDIRNDNRGRRDANDAFDNNGGGQSNFNSGGGDDETWD